MGVHFISGLPRSGSTLLAAILRQNPTLHTQIASPLGKLVIGALRNMSADEEGYGFFDEAKRAAILRGIFRGFYHDVHEEKTVLDGNRLWTAKLPTLKTIYPTAKMVCCVRDMPWIFDSIERLVQRNSLLPSGLFGFEASGTVYDRFEHLIQNQGLVGFAWAGLRQAFYGSDVDSLLLVTFESLTREPEPVLAQIYEFLGLPYFSHDFDNVEFSAEELDNFLGTPGLHRVRAKVSSEARQTILPPELYKRAAVDTFWKDAALNPNNVRVI